MRIMLLRLTTESHPHRCEFCPDSLPYLHHVFARWQVCCAVVGTGVNSLGKLGASVLVAFACRGKSDVRVCTGEQAFFAFHRIGKRSANICRRLGRPVERDRDRQCNYLVCQSGESVNR